MTGLFVFTFNKIKYIYIKYFAKMNYSARNELSNIMMTHTKNKIDNRFKRITLVRYIFYYTLY